MHIFLDIHRIECEMNHKLHLIVCEIRLFIELLNFKSFEFIDASTCSAI